MIKMYGIPTCGSVRKAKKFFKDNEIEFEFIDFKITSVECEKIDKWLEQIDMKLLFNSRGTKYRTLNLKELTLDDIGKREWLCKENMLIKRPVLEFNDKIIVAFNEEKYNLLFK